MFSSSRSGLFSRECRTLFAWVFLLFHLEDLRSSPRASFHRLRPWPAFLLSPSTFADIFNLSSPFMLHPAFPRSSFPLHFSPRAWRPLLFPSLPPSLPFSVPSAVMRGGPAVSPRRWPCVIVLSVIGTNPHLPRPSQRFTPAEFSPLSPSPLPIFSA